MTAAAVRGGLLVLAIGALGLTFAVRGRGRPLRAPTPHDECRERHVADELEMLDAEGLSGSLHALCDQSDVDIRVVTVKSVPDDDLERFALGYARDKGVGRLLNSRSVVIVYDRATNRMRIEVGPGLQGVLPDGFVGSLMREQAGAMFQQEPGLSVLATLIVLRYRIASAQLGEAYDPALVRRLTDRLRLATGGGTSTEMVRSAFTRHRATPAEQELFAPQPTIADTHARYMLWLSAGAVASDVPLFYGRTEHAFPMAQTQAGAIFMGWMEEGQRYAVGVRGDLGILVFTSTPLASPHLYRHGPAGWQLDASAETIDTKEIATRGFTWTMRDTRDDFSRAFADVIVDIDGVRRIASGDNRRLVSVFAQHRPSPDDR